jgi:hypothetical protein
LHDGSEYIVPVFDAKAIILDIFTNKTCMQKQNIAPGYDVFSGDADEKHIDNQRYGKIHTGDSWLPARDKFLQLISMVDREKQLINILLKHQDKKHNVVLANLQYKQQINFMT